MGIHIGILHVIIWKRVTKQHGCFQTTSPAGARSPHENQLTNYISFAPAFFIFIYTFLRVRSVGRGTGTVDNSPSNCERQTLPPLRRFPFVKTFLKQLRRGGSISSLRARGSICIFRLLFFRIFSLSVSASLSSPSLVFHRRFSTSVPEHPSRPHSGF